MSFNDLFGQLQDPSAAKKLAALEALSRTKLTPMEQQRLIMQALEDAEALVRSTAIEAAIDVNAVGTVPRLAVLLGEDEDATVRACAAEAMGELGDMSAVSTLVAALKDNDTAVRSFAANSLGLLGEPMALTGLRAALDSEVSPAVALNISFALARLGTVRDWAPVADLVLACARSGHGLEALNAIRDFASRPQLGLLSEAAKPLVAALGLSRESIDVSDVPYLEETISVLRKGAELA